ncbi:MAG: FkbM family methyltransferase [Patescibacteria group bacterium]
MFSKKLQGYTFFYSNDIEFRYLYEEIFKKYIYYVQLETMEPRILDCGAHIGLACIYFKSTYPGARITAFEPEPPNLELLKENLQINQMTDVEIIPKALWSTEGQMQLHVDIDQENHWSSTSSLLKGSWTTKQPTAPIVVETVKLSTYLNEPIDILKIDIEGAETEVLKECRDQLVNVKYLFVEFHATRLHRPEELVTLLMNSGFELTVFADNQEVPLNRMTRRKPTLYMIEAVRNT